MPGLLIYVRRRLLGDHTLSGLHEATGAPVGLLRRLSLETGDVQAPPLPEAIGVLIFRWRRRQRLLITDIQTGCPVDLLTWEDHDARPEHLHAWLTQPERGGVRQVWVEQPRWLPKGPSSGAGPRYHLDAFERGRVLQRAVQALQRDFTDVIQVGVRRTPGLKGHRKLLLGTPDEGRWPLIDRVHVEERRRLRQDMLDRAPALAWGLGMIEELRATLTRDVDEAGLRTWEEYLELCAEEEIARQPGQAQALRRAWTALRRLTGPLREAELRRAVVARARADGRRVSSPEGGPERLEEVGEPEPPLSLARSRRRLKDLRESQAFRARDDLAWERLRRVALTRIGRTA